MVSGLAFHSFMQQRERERRRIMLQVFEWEQACQMGLEERERERDI